MGFIQLMTSFYRISFSILNGPFANHSNCSPMRQCDIIVNENQYSLFTTLFRYYSFTNERMNKNKLECKIIKSLKSEVWERVIFDG
jgi:hypothetical protein